jgi:hypothetical protein
MDGHRAPTFGITARNFAAADTTPLPGEPTPFEIRAVQNETPGVVPLADETGRSAGKLNHDRGLAELDWIGIGFGPLEYQYVSYMHDSRGQYAQFY